MPFAIGPIIGFGVFAALVVGAYFLIDAIGDRREAAVRAEYVEAARKKNVEIAGFNSADDAIAAIAEAALQQHLATAQKVAGSCPFTPEQAAALTVIRKVK